MRESQRAIDYIAQRVSLGPQPHRWGSSAVSMSVLLHALDDAPGKFYADVIDQLKDLLDDSDRGPLQAKRDDRPEDDE